MSKICVTEKKSTDPIANGIINSTARISPTIRTDHLQPPNRPRRRGWYWYCGQLPVGQSCVARDSCTAASCESITAACGNGGASNGIGGNCGSGSGSGSTAASPVSSGVFGTGVGTAVRCTLVASGKASGGAHPTSTHRISRIDKRFTRPAPLHQGSLPGPHPSIPPLVSAWLRTVTIRSGPTGTGANFGRLTRRGGGC